MRGTSGSRIERCCLEEGGCDKQFVLDYTTEIKTSAREITGESKTTSEDGSNGPLMT